MKQDMMLQGFTQGADALGYLDRIGGMEDARIDIFEGALALALLDHPGISVDKYRQHLNKMLEQAREEETRLFESGMTDVLTRRCEILRSVMAQKNGYAGDFLSPDNLENADIMRVIDRRLGLPIAIAIVAIALGRAMGWEVHGLNFPGHFLVRVDADGGRAILDPFDLFKELSAPDLRALLKKLVGAKAELSAQYYEPATNRNILLRLQNNIKHRAIESEDFERALHVISLMKRIAPQETRLLFDEGIVLARMDRPADAVEALKAYIETTPDGPDKWHALDLMREISAMLTLGD